MRLTATLVISLLCAAAAPGSGFDPGRAGGGENRARRDPDRGFETRYFGAFETAGGRMMIRPREAMAPGEVAAGRACYEVDIEGRAAVLCALRSSRSPGVVPTLAQQLAELADLERAVEELSAQLAAARVAAPAPARPRVGRARRDLPAFVSSPVSWLGAADP